MAEEGTSPGTGGTSPSDDGQGGSQSTGSVNSDEGQGGTSPSDDGQGGKAPGDDETGDAGAQAPQFDNDTLKWFESKGHDASAYDPANESHTKLINQVREQERQFTKQQQEKKNQETFEKARITQPETTGDEKSPLDTFEDNFRDNVLAAMRYNGVETHEELYKKNPQVYKDLENSYTLDRQKAWEKTQDWKAEQQNKTTERENQEAQARSDFKTAKDLSDQTLNALRGKYPNLDANFAKYGVNKFVQALTDSHSVYSEMLFLNEDVANFLAESADAIAYRHAEADRKAEWEQEYHKNQMKIQAAQAPKPAGLGSLHGAGKPISSGWKDNLYKDSKNLIKT